jgi:hypothetical protein
MEVLEGQEKILAIAYHNGNAFIRGFIGICPGFRGCAVHLYFVLR